jgi:hypothetical protein
MSLSDEVKNTMKHCVIIVICVSREYKVNQCCQRVARYALEREKKGSIVLFALMQGDYTTNSTPERINGWLGHMVKGNNLYPI